MLYVSSKRGNKFGVTDTDDDVEEFYTDREIAKLLESKKVYIYGTSYYNYQANCTPLRVPIRLELSKLKELLKKWGEVHNPWNGHPVEDYLAQAVIGTIIDVKYYDIGSNGETFTGRTLVRKLTYDRFEFEDANCIDSGTVGDARYAASCLERACIYSRMSQIKIKGVAFYGEM
jgi:hypothetical protein